MKNAALTCTDTPTSSSVNKKLCLDLGITAWIAWLVAPAVDLSVVGLLTGMRFLSLHGYTRRSAGQAPAHAAVLRHADARA